MHATAHINYITNIEYFPPNAAHTHICLCVCICVCVSIFIYDLTSFFQLTPLVLMWSPLPSVVIVVQGNILQWPVAFFCTEEFEVIPFLYSKIPGKAVEL